MAGKGKMAEEWDKHRPLKVTVVGDGCVGKTCLLTSYITGEFQEHTDPTVYETYTCTVAVDGVDYSLMILDTPNSEGFDKLSHLLYPGTHVFILCFALDRPNHFESLSFRWLPLIHCHCPKTPIVLVGTKMDVRNLDVRMPHDGKELVERHQLHKYVECSAKTQEGLQEVFNAVVRAAMAPVAQRSRPCFIL